MARGFVRRDNLTKDTLLALALMGVITIAGGASPYFLHQVVKMYFKDRSEKSKRARAKRLREMERRKLISFRELGRGKVRIELTFQGKQLVRQYELEHMKLKKPDRWDGVWHIVIYDIPTAQKKAGMAFHRKLKDLGLFPLQKSVWVSPYACVPEIEFLAVIFEIDFDRCICHFTTKTVPKEREVKKFFNL